MERPFPSTKTCRVRTERLVKNAGIQLPKTVQTISEREGGELIIGDETTPVGDLEENVRPLSYFRAARSQVAERHGARNHESLGSSVDVSEMRSDQECFIGDPMLSFSLEHWLMKAQFGED